MRKSSKERREEMARREKALQTEIAMDIKSQPVKTCSAKEPAYLYTVLCPDPKRRIAKYVPMLRIHKSMGK
jgi:hypothetical protein